MAIVWCFSNYIQLRVLEQMRELQKSPFHLDYLFTLKFVYKVTWLCRRHIIDQPFELNRLPRQVLDELILCDLELTTRQWLFWHSSFFTWLRSWKKGQELWFKRTKILIMTDSKCHMGKPPFTSLSELNHKLLWPPLSHCLSLVHKHLSPKPDKHTQTHMVVLVRSEVSVRRMCGSKMRDHHHHHQ